MDTTSEEIPITSVDYLHAWVGLKLNLEAWADNEGSREELLGIFTMPVQDYEAYVREYQADRSEEMMAAIDPESKALLDDLVEEFNTFTPEKKIEVFMEYFMSCRSLVRKE